MSRHRTTIRHSAPPPAGTRSFTSAIAPPNTGAPSGPPTARFTVVEPVPTASPLDAVPIRTAAGRDATRCEIDVRAVFLLLLVDDTSTLSRIAAISGMPFAEVLTIFEDLDKIGVVTLSSERPSAESVPAAAAAEPPRAELPRSGVRRARDSDPSR